MTLRIAMVSMHSHPLAQPGTSNAGGMNVYITEVAKRLAELECMVDLFTLSNEDYSQDIFRGVRLIGIKPSGRIGPQMVDMLNHVPGFAQRILEHEPYDIFHSHYWLSGMASDIVSSQLDTPHILNMHTIGAVKNTLLAEGDDPEPPIRLESEKRLARKVSKVITSTLTEASAVSRYYGIRFENIAVVSPGVDTTVFYPKGNCTQENEGGNHLWAPVATNPAGFLAVLSRIQPLKGQDLAIRTLASLRKIMFDKCPSLIIAGDQSEKYNNYAASLRRMALDLQVEDLVHFTGVISRKQVAMVMRNAQLLLVPSHSETFGLVTLEAAASGTPVVASLTDGLIDAIVPNITGILIAERNPDIWAKNIANLLMNKNRHKSLSRSSVRHAQDHDWTKTAAQILSLYRQFV
ncbi:MAG: glycosyltransferase [Tropheryma whipplei]|nr:glycosyltransferase [Tropheryma whipplei]